MRQCIRIDSESHDQGASLSLPQWFCHGKDCRLSPKRINLENFSVYLQ